MKLFIFDHRELFKRASTIQDALSRAGHSAVWYLHVDGTKPGDEEEIRSWKSTKSAAVALVALCDSVLLHVGRDQSHRAAFLGQCCSNIPVLCYSGAGVEDEIKVLCRTNGSHAIYPQPIHDIPADSALEEITRWVGQIEAAKGDRDAIRQACQKIEGFDQDCEDKLQFLSAILRGVDVEAVRTLGARLGVSGETNRDRLAELRKSLFPEW